LEFQKEDDDDEAKEDEFKVYESGVVGSLARARFEWWREIRVRELRRTIDRVRTQNCLNFVSNRGAHQRCRWLVRLFVHLTLSLSLSYFVNTDLIFSFVGMVAPKPRT
jgi:type IV secretory pathway TraG/TraD family ATPase VirD4